MHDLMTTEGPALLGYLAFGTFVAVAGFIAHLAGPECRHRRRRNRLARARRHAAKGCELCSLRVRYIEDEDKLDALERRITTAKLEELLDNPVQGGHR